MMPSPLPCGCYGGITIALLTFVQAFMTGHLCILMSQSMK